MTDESDPYKEIEDIILNRLDCSKLDDHGLCEELNQCDFLSIFENFHLQFVKKNTEIITCEFFEEFLFFLEKNQEYLPIKRKKECFPDIVAGIINFFIEYGFPNQIENINELFSNALCLLLFIFQIIDYENDLIDSSIQQFIQFINSNEMFAPDITNVFIVIYKKSHGYTDLFIQYICNIMDKITEQFDVDNMVHLIKFVANLPNSDSESNSEFFKHLSLLCMNLLSQEISSSLSNEFFSNLYSLFSSSALFRVNFENDFSFFRQCVIQLQQKDSNDIIFSIFQFIYNCLLYYERDGESSRIINILDLFSPKIYYSHVFPYLINADQMELFSNFISLHKHYTYTLSYLPDEHTQEMILSHLSNLIHNSVVQMKNIACKLLYIYSDVIPLIDSESIANDIFIEDLIRILMTNSDDNEILYPIKILAEIIKSLDDDDDDVIELHLFESLAENEIGEHLEYYLNHDEINFDYAEDISTIFNFMDRVATKLPGKEEEES